MVHAFCASDVTAYEACGFVLDIKRWRQVKKPIVALCRSILKARKSVTKRIYNALVPPVGNLPVEILHAVDQCPQALLNVCPWMRSFIAWILRTLTFDEGQQLLSVPVEVSERVTVAWIKNPHVVKNPVK